MQVDVACPKNSPFVNDIVVTITMDRAFTVMSDVLQSHLNQRISKKPAKFKCCQFKAHIQRTNNILGLDLGLALINKSLAEHFNFMSDINIQKMPAFKKAYKKLPL